MFDLRFFLFDRWWVDRAAGWAAWVGCAAGSVSGSLSMARVPTPIRRAKLSSLL
jgi:hypothetical protein